MDRQRYNEVKERIRATESKMRGWDENKALWDEVERDCSPQQKSALYRTWLAGSMPMLSTPTCITASSRRHAMTPEEKVSGQIVDEQTAQIDDLTAERDRLKAEVWAHEQTAANYERNWKALLQASRDITAERDTLRTRQDKLVEALEAIFPWDGQPDNNGYDQCWCCEAYCEDRCTNPKCGAFKARAALAAIENEVTADGHVADEAGLEEEVMEGGGE